MRVSDLKRSKSIDTSVVNINMIRCIDPEKFSGNRYKENRLIRILGFTGVTYLLLLISMGKAIPGARIHRYC